MQIVAMLVGAMLAESLAMVCGNQDDGVVPFRRRFQDLHQPADLRVKISKAVVIAVDQRLAVGGRQRAARTEPAFGAPAAHHRFRQLSKAMVERSGRNVGAVRVKIVDVNVEGARGGPMPQPPEDIGVQVRGIAAVKSVVPLQVLVERLHGGAPQQRP